MRSSSAVERAAQTSIESPGPMIPGNAKEGTDKLARACERGGAREAGVAAATADAGADDGTGDCTAAGDAAAADALGCADSRDDGTVAGEPAHARTTSARPARRKV